MKLWKWIKSLKVPRLILEALLIFASVYFALILEADRSEDFERNNLIAELKQLKSGFHADSLYGTLYFDARIEGGKMAKFKEGRDLLLDSGDTRLLVENFRDVLLLRPKVLRKAPPQLINIQDNYLYLFEDSIALSTIRWQIEKYQRMTDWGEKIQSLEMNFRTTTLSDYQIYYTDKQSRNAELERLFKSQEFRNYSYYIQHWTMNFKRNMQSCAKNYPNIKDAIDNEIQAQEEAMKGIF